MADDVNPDRRAEYEAALAVLAPQIEGLQSIGNDPDMSPDAHNKILEELSDRVRRDGLLRKALADLDACNAAHDALLDDGYPDMPKGMVTAQVFDELAARRTAVDAAVEQFETALLTVSLGSPRDKP